jgi:hypothetical protein
VCFSYPHTHKAHTPILFEKVCLKKLLMPGDVAKKEPTTTLQNETFLPVVEEK